MLDSITTRLFENGILGVLCVILIGVIIVLDRRLTAAYEKLITQNQIITTAVTESTATMRDVKEAQITAAEASREHSAAITLITAKMSK